jgi:hypothetical protein
MLLYAFSMACTGRILIFWSGFKQRLYGLRYRPTFAHANQ